MQRKVFLSYSSHDAAAAVAVCRELEAAGIACWMAPRDIPGGADYGDVIDKAIIGCGVFVLLFSAHSNVSQWVRGEVNLAFTENKPIVPYRLDDAPLTGAMRLILNQMHWLDVHADPDCKELAATVLRLLNTAGATSLSNNTNPIVSPTAQTAQTTPTAPAPQADGATRRRAVLLRRLWIAAVIVVVVGLMQGGFWLSSRGEGGEPEEASAEVVDSLQLAHSQSDSLARAEAALEAERRQKREAAERAERAEEERIRKAKQAEERAARERDSLQRVLQDRERAAAERERIERELDSLEQVRLEAERIAQQTAERLAREKAEREAAEKAERERQERLAREREEQERLAREKAEKEKAEREAAEKEKAEKEQAEREAAEREQAAQAARKRYKVGDLYQDEAGRKGIVFRVDATGEHGTIVDMRDSDDKMEWCKMTDDEPLMLIEASSRSNGASNQRQVMIQPQYGSRYPAFVWCMTRRGGGWYMPSIEELELFSNNAALLHTVNTALEQNGGRPLHNRGYWSSSEDSARKAFSVYINANTGNYSSAEGKWVRNYVRAVYRF